MGYFFEFDEADNAFRCSFVGEVKDGALVEAVAKWRRFLAARPGGTAICDFSGVTEFEVSSESIKTAALAPPGGEEKWVVVIVAPEDLVYGLARMFSILTETQRPNRHVVRTIEEAYELLGIKDPQFSRVQPT